jgi:hypothetical protein
MAGTGTWPLACSGCGWTWNAELTGAPGSPVKCPRCRKSKRIPKQAWGAQRPAARFGMSAARRRSGGRADRAPALLGEPEEPDGQAGADLELWQRAAESIVSLFGAGQQPAERVLEPTTVVPPARPGAAGDDLRADRPRGPVLMSPRRRQRRSGPDWPGVLPSAARWCASCRAERKRTAAKYQAELAVAPFAADLCGTCLARLWREVPEAVALARRLPALAQGAAEPVQDALLRRLAAAGLRVPALPGLSRPDGSEMPNRRTRAGGGLGGGRSGPPGWRLGAGPPLAGSGSGDR